MKTNFNGNRTITEDKSPTRLLALSDGVFATVLTVLVLDLRIPEAIQSNGGNLNAIVHWLGPHLFGYLLTFLVAGTYWLAHHRNFEHILQVNRGLLSYNLLFLLFIGLLPFTTASIGASESDNSFRFFWCLYAANMAMAGLISQLTWAYAVSHQLVAAGTTRRQDRYITMRQLTTPAVFLVSILAELIFPFLFVGPLILLAVPPVRWIIDRKYGETETEAGPSKRSEALWRMGRILPWLLIIGLAIWAIIL